MPSPSTIDLPPQRLPVFRLLCIGLGVLAFFLPWDRVRIYPTAPGSRDRSGAELLVSGEAIGMGAAALYLMGLYLAGRAAVRIDLGASLDPSARLYVWTQQAISLVLWAGPSLVLPAFRPSRWEFGDGLGFTSALLYGIASLRSLPKVQVDAPVANPLSLALHRSAALPFWLAATGLLTLILLWVGPGASPDMRLPWSVRREEHSGVSVLLWHVGKTNQSHLGVASLGMIALICAATALRRVSRARTVEAASHTARSAFLGATILVHVVPMFLWGVGLLQFVSRYYPHAGGSMEIRSGAVVNFAVFCACAVSIVILSPIRWWIGLQRQREKEWADDLADRPRKDDAGPL